MTSALLTFLGLPMVCAGALGALRARDILDRGLARCAVLVGVGLILAGRASL